MVDDEKQASLNPTEPQQHIILFYKYHPLSSDWNVTEKYREALETLCTSLCLAGRILVGCSENEGINGTLSGSLKDDVLSFTYALRKDVDLTGLSDYRRAAIEAFRSDSEAFFRSIRQDELQMSAEDFKWSSTTSEEDLFPDCNVKLVKELIGTGGALTGIRIDETAKGYLTPVEWKSELETMDDDTLLIDCRNTKEYQIGHFDAAMDPRTTTFQQFPKWVQEHEHLLSKKKVLMYCTGGIRCEKTIPTVKDVKHLKGGIHKFLDAYGNEKDSKWRGKNFVFDSRGSTGTTRAENETKTVGRCIECEQAFDEFDSTTICTVCREPVLVCLVCRKRMNSEFHCVQHRLLKSCYFSNLGRFSVDQLERQKMDLEKILQDVAVGKKFRQKRKTLQKQIDRVSVILEDKESRLLDEDNVLFKCRSCGEASCSGRCWGFYGLKRKVVLEQIDRVSHKHYKSKSQTISINLSREEHRKALFEDLKAIGENGRKPHVHWDRSTGIRIPPPFVRSLQCYVKAKWCGESVSSVLQREFHQLHGSLLNEVLCQGLVRLNNVAVLPTSAATVKLKGGDLLSRIVHWHEPPVLLPNSTIEVKRISIPSEVVKDYNLTDKLSEAYVYACNKPSTVPTHPTGPYLLNTLTMLVEAQEHEDCHALNPLHRIDRATSGLTLLSPLNSVSRLFHSCQVRGDVQKLYLAMVCGKFPSNSDSAVIPLNPHDGKYTFDDENVLHVDASIVTSDPANGIRQIRRDGKPARSKFKLVHYSQETNCSIVICVPVTGRSHQLRVHLQWLGFPIVGDIQYGAISEKKSGVPLDHILGRMSKAENAYGHSNRTEVSEKAKVACTSCKGREGILKSFTEAQLLQKGHSIHLHSLRYRLLVHPKRSPANSTLAPLATIDFDVSKPTWANHIDNRELGWF